MMSGTSGRREWTVAVFIVHQGRILLLRHRKLNRWLPPGGHIEPGEIPDEAAAREVWEETGLKIGIEPNGLPPHLARPRGVQLEEISPGHQHIDLVYLLRLVPQAPPGAGRGSEAPPALRGNAESLGLGWYGPADLAAMDLDEEMQLWAQLVLREEALALPAVMVASAPTSAPVPAAAEVRWAAWVMCRERGERGGRHRYLLVSSRGDRESLRLPGGLLAPGEWPDAALARHLAAAGIQVVLEGGGALPLRRPQQLTRPYRLFLLEKEGVRQVNFIYKGEVTGFSPEHNNAAYSWFEPAGKDGEVEADHLVPYIPIMAAF